MKREQALWFIAGAVVSSAISIGVSNIIAKKKELERIELEEKFRNKPVSEDKDYIMELSRYYRIKSNRAKISKKTNDVKKYDMVSRALRVYKTIKDK